jgi:hypothetical protein
MRDAGGVDDSVHARQRFRHVLRFCQIADDGAGGRKRNAGRTAQQDAQAVAALGQFPQQMLADETGRAGQRNERFA